MSGDDWDRLAANWRSSGASHSADHIREHVLGEERRLRRARFLETVVALGGILGVGAALIHTHDPLDIITAAVTIAGLGALLRFGRSSRQDLENSIGGSTTEFIAASGRRVRLRLRVISFIWIAIGLDLVFFLPWWISGYRVHRAELDAPVMLASWWFPLVTLSGLLVWSMIIRRRLGAEHSRLRELEAAYRED